MLWILAVVSIYAVLASIMLLCFIARSLRAQEQHREAMMKCRELEDAYVESTKKLSVRCPKCGRFIKSGKDIKYCHNCGKVIAL